MIEVTFVSHFAPIHLLAGISLEQVVTASWEWQPGWIYQIAP